jgi:drug/metabolite transporter (DMT)-like permease
VGRRSVAALAACGALFGLSYVLVRIAVVALGPVATTAVRTVLGGTSLLLVARHNNQAPRLRHGWRYLALGLVSAAVPFSLISASMLTLNAGTAAVLNTTSPMFALTIDSVRRRRWPVRGQQLGLVVATGGVVFVMAERGLRLSGPGAVAGVLAGLAGAAVFAYGGFFAADRFPGVPPLSVAAGQQLAAGAILTPAVLAVPPAGPLTPSVLIDVAVLGLLGSGAAYLLFYWLIDREGPLWTANVNLLVPCFGVLWGWVLVGEPVPPLSLLGMVVTVAGLTLILRSPPRASGDRQVPGRQRDGQTGRGD